MMFHYVTSAEALMRMLPRGPLSWMFVFEGEGRTRACIQ